MGTYLKHKDGQPRKKRESKPAQSQSNPAVEYAESDYRHSRCVEQALDGLTSVLSTYVSDARSGGHNDYSEIATKLEDIHKSLWSYVNNAVNGDNSLGLFTGPHDYPMRLVLEGDAVDSIADSLKRIADAMAATRAEGVESYDKNPRS